jgi:spermidine/putrescine transport system permease protein
MNHLLARSYSALVFLFLYLPLAVMGAYSFNASKFSLSWKGFTLKWYAGLLHNTSLIEAAMHSLTIAACCACISAIIGTFAALILHQYRFAGRKSLFVIFFVMIMSPDIVIAISLLTLYLLLQIPLGFTSLLLAHITLCVPFVATTIYSRLKTFDPAVIDAARDLGAGEYQIFRHVILPITWPAVMAGWLLSFTMSLDDVIIAFFTTGPTFEVLPLRIYSMVRLGIKPEVNALCVVMIAVTLIAFFLARFLLKEKKS